MISPVTYERCRRRMEPGAVQRPRDRTALMPRHSGDENRSIAYHTPSQ